MLLINKNLMRKLFPFAFLFAFSKKNHGLKKSEEKKLLLSFCLVLFLYNIFQLTNISCCPPLGKSCRLLAAIIISLFMTCLLLRFFSLDSRSVSFEKCVLDAQEIVMMYFSTAMFICYLNDFD